jgi:hypothetical protein
VGGRRERHFAGTSLQPRNLPENAATPTRRVHAVLGGYKSLATKLWKDYMFPFSTVSYKNHHDVTQHTSLH